MILTLMSLRSSIRIEFALIVVYEKFQLNLFEIILKAITLIVSFGY